MYIDTDRLDIWESPDSYGGYDPVGHIIIGTRSRDSNIMEKVNYKIMMEGLANFAKVERLEDTAGWNSDPDDSPMAYTFRAGHWGCGWVEYLVIRPCEEAQAAIDYAVEITCAMAQYPVLDEGAYSEACSIAREDYWIAEDTKGRMALCQDAMCSIFKARSVCIPIEVENMLQDWNNFQ